MFFCFLFCGCVRHPELIIPCVQTIECRAPHHLMTKEFLPKLTHKMSITDEIQSG